MKAQSKNVKTFELKNCPFCGSKNLEVLDEKEMYTDNPFSVVICNNCFAKGGEGRNDKQAEMLWNLRYK